MLDFAGLLEEMSEAKCRHAMTGMPADTQPLAKQLLMSSDKKVAPKFSQKGQYQKSWFLRSQKLQKHVSLTCLRLVALAFTSHCIELLCLHRLSCCCLFQGLSPIYFCIYSGIFTQLQRATAISIQVSTKISLPKSPKKLRIRHASVHLHHDHLCCAKLSCEHSIV